MECAEEDDNHCYHPNFRLELDINKDGLPVYGIRHGTNDAYQVVPREVWLDLAKLSMLGTLRGISALLEEGLGADFAPLERIARVMEDR